MIVKNINIIYMSTSFTQRITDLEKYIEDIECIYPMTYYPYTEKIVAIGDIHGDFEALLRILHAAKIIDRQGLWIAGNTTLVQTGDIVDDSRYSFKRKEHLFNFKHLPEDELFIYGFFADLNLQANAVGGRVLLCMGNHEYTHIIHEMGKDDYYTQPSTIDWYNTFGLNKRYEIFKPGGILAKKLACMLNLVVVVGDWIFCHGGLNCSSIFSRADLEDINRKMGMYMRDGLENLSIEDQLEYRHRFYDNEFVLYDRRYSINQYEDDKSDTCKDFERIKKVLEMPDAKIVIGHTVQELPNSICDDSIYRIDTAMSRAFGPKDKKTDRLFALLIIKNKPFMVDGTGNVYRVPDNKKYREILNSENKPTLEYVKQKDLICREEDIPEIIYDDMDLI
jgi:hypothetical protein